MDNRIIGKFIKKKRKEIGLTQIELGDKLGVSDKAISKWETGNSLPDIGILKSLSDILGISTSELLNGREDNNKDVKGNKIVIIIGICLIVISIILVIIININKNKEIMNGSNNYDCTLTEIYNIDNINLSNDENYLYVSLKKFQTEGVYTIKLPKSISDDLEKGKSYEFVFEIDKEYLKDNPDVIFNNSKIINVNETNKQGLEQTSFSTCTDK